MNSIILARKRGTKTCTLLAGPEVSIPAQRLRMKTFRRSQTSTEYEWVGRIEGDFEAVQLTAPKKTETK